MKIRFGIKVKMVAIFTASLVVTLSAVVAVSSVMNSGNMMKVAKSNLHAVTENVVDSVRQLFDERTFQVRSVAKTPYVIEFLENGGSRSYVEKLLAAQFTLYNQFENYFIADKNGRIVLDATGGTAVGVDVTSYPFWRLKSERLEYHIDDVVYKSPVTGMLVLVVATRVENAKGDFLGLVCLPMDWENFAKNHVDNVKIGETGYVVITDKAKNIVAHPDSKLILTAATEQPFMKSALEAGDGFMEYASGGEKRFLDHVKLPLVNFTVLTTVSENEYYHGIKTTNLIVIVASVLIGLAGLLVVFLFTRTVADGITLIAEGARRFSVGDFALEGMDFGKIGKINARKDEMGEIGKAFNSLIEYLRQKTSLAEQIAQSNLDADAPVSSEADALGKALKHMVTTLNTLISQIRGAADQVSAGAGQVASSSQSLSQGASEQASSLEEITSSITEINSQSKQNSENAAEANGLAARSKENAEKGNGLIKDLTTAMNTINVSSEEIKKIVKTIDNIAFQINLLALNANVEAARAGKFGKGFAVVAEEVRNLATRSASSAKETNEMVEAAIKNIESGNRLVEETATQFTGIVEGASKVVDLVQEISLASKEQAEGLQQINAGLLQINQVTQSNTANAEESASAAEELSSQALQLKGTVSQFKLMKAVSQQKERTETRYEELKKYLNDEVIKNILQDYALKHGADHGGNGNGAKSPAAVADKAAVRAPIGPEEVIALDDTGYEHF